MKKQKLIDFCKAKGIAVPPNPSLDFLHAAIVRATLHQTKMKRDGKTCFGFWEHENSTCTTCDFEKKCFKASVGMSKEEYFKKLEALENPQLRFHKGPLKRT